MSSDTSASASVAPLAGENITASKWLDLYKEICSNIRTTDDISFKLLGLVPTIAGSAAGALALLDKFQLLKASTSGVVLALAITGLMITIGFFRWELRNIQKCNWFIDRAAELEDYALNGAPPKHIQYLGWRDEPRPTLKQLKCEWGKTESETLVYLGAMLAWCVPIAFAGVSLWMK